MLGSGCSTIFASCSAPPLGRRCSAAAVAAAAISKMNNNNYVSANNANGNNNNNYYSRKCKRGNSNPKSKKQLENELNRQRSFFVTSQHNHSTEYTAQGGYLNGSNSGIVGQKKHPTLAIYRPPSVRDDINNNSDHVCIANGLQKSKNLNDVPNISESCRKLNVNAKEFSLERSNTAPQSISINGAKSENISYSGEMPVLSRSRTFYVNSEIKPNNQKKYFEYKGYRNNFQHTKNIQQKDSQGPKVQFKEPKRKPKPLSHDETNKYVHQVDSKKDFILRKSKSYNGPDTKYPQNTTSETNILFKNTPHEFCVKDLSTFPDDINDMAKRVVKDTKNSPSKDLMLLALKIIEHSVSKQDAMSTSVSLSLYIIEKDTRDTYVNMIINTIQLWFVKREKLLQPPRFCSYATFVLQMYKGMKQNKVLSNRMEKEVYSRKQTLLMLLFKICEHCLTPGKEKDCVVKEIECLFEIVTVIGQDLELEVPETLKQLYVLIRDALLLWDCPLSAKKTLLHLIELKASKWVLSCSAINYYNSKTIF